MKERRGIGSRFSRPLLALASVLLTVGLLEGGLRLFAPVPLHPVDLFLGQSPGMARGDVRLVPGVVARHRTGEFDVPVRVSSQGLRDREFALPKPRGTYRILVLGDSQTFGWGVRAEDSYPKVLERFLRQGPDGARGDVDVLNAGVPGSGTAQQLQFLERAGWRYDPDAVVLGFFYNDVPENSQSRLYAVEGGRLVERARGGGLAQAFPALLAEGKELLVPFRVRYSPRPPEPPFLIRVSHLARFVRAKLAVGRAELRTTVARPGSGLELTAHLLAEVQRRCDARRRAFLVVLIPSHFDLNARGRPAAERRAAAVTERLRDAPATVLDLAPAFAAAGGERLFFSEDHHLTGEGHRVAAEAIARRLRKRGLPPAPPVPGAGEARAGR